MNCILQKCQKLSNTYFNVVWKRISTFSKVMHQNNSTTHQLRNTGVEYNQLVWGPLGGFTSIKNCTAKQSWQPLCDISSTNISINQMFTVNLFWAVRLSFSRSYACRHPSNNNWHFIMPFTVTEILHLWTQSIQYVNQITCLSVQIKEAAQICVCGDAA